MVLNPICGAGTVLPDETVASDFVRTVPFSYIQKGFEAECSVTAFRGTLTSTAGPTVNLTPAISPYYRPYLLMYTSGTNTGSYSTSIVIL
jgi:hypothetical protein